MVERFCDADTRRTVEANIKLPKKVLNALRKDSSKEKSESTVAAVAAAINIEDIDDFYYFSGCVFLLEENHDAIAALKITNSGRAVTKSNVDSILKIRNVYSIDIKEKIVFYNY